MAMTGVKKPLKHLLFQLTAKFAYSSCKMDFFPPQKRKAKQHVVYYIHCSS